MNLDTPSGLPVDQDRNATYRKARHQQEHRRLRSNLLALVTADPRTVPLGSDQVIEDLLVRNQIGDEEVAVLKMRFHSRIVSLIAVPNRHWYGPAKLRLLALRSAARASGHRAILVPERAIRREPRLANSQSVAKYRQFTPPLRDVLAIQAYLSDQGPSSLRECLEQVRDSEPVGTLLHMISAGLLSIDLNRRITGATRVTEAAEEDAGTA